MIAKRYGYQAGRLAAAFFALIVVASAQSANAGPAAGSFRLRATVPLSCWVRPDRELLAVDGAAGFVTEACNNPGGFTVTAQHRSLSSNESGRLVYGDNRLDLTREPGQVVSRSDRATIRRVNYRFDQIKLESPLVVVLTIRPI